MFEKFRAWREAKALAKINSDIRWDVGLCRDDQGFYFRHKCGRGTKVAEERNYLEIDKLSDITDWHEMSWQYSDDMRQKITAEIRADIASRPLPPLPSGMIPYDGKGKPDNWDRGQVFMADGYYGFANIDHDWLPGGTPNNCRGGIIGYTPTKDGKPYVAPERQVTFSILMPL